jgi:hypothetical protein
MYCGCEKRLEQVDVRPERPVYQEAAQIEKRLRSLGSDVQSVTLAPALASEVRIWIWGTCQEVAFEKIAAEFKFLVDQDAVSRWPGALVGPQGKAGWGFKMDEPFRGFARLDPRYRMIAAYQDKTIFIAMVSQ